MRWWCDTFHRNSHSQWTLMEWVWTDEVMLTTQQEVHIMYCKRCHRILAMEGAG